jgi:hypothetical protein
VTITYANDKKADVTPGRGKSRRLRTSRGLQSRLEPIRAHRAEGVPEWLVQRNGYSGSNSFRKVTRLIKYLRMFNVAIDSKLQGCDLVRLRVADVHLGDSIRLRTTIVQQKTGRPVPFEVDRANARGTRLMAPATRITQHRLALPAPQSPNIPNSTSPSATTATTCAGLGCVFIFAFIGSVMPRRSNTLPME